MDQKNTNSELNSEINKVIEKSKMKSRVLKKILKEITKEEGFNIDSKRQNNKKNRTMCLKN